MRPRLGDGWIPDTNTNFEILNYDNFTEVYYQFNCAINLINFFTFDNIMIGFIEYEYDNLDRLIKEKWYKGEKNLVRDFSCFYEWKFSKYIYKDLLWYAQ